VREGGSGGICSVMKSPLLGSPTVRRRPREPVANLSATAADRQAQAAARLSLRGLRDYGDYGGLR
jgi:hypothetical protein